MHSKSVHALICQIYMGEPQFSEPLYDDFVRLYSSILIPGNTN